jgi:hypothetical protein
MVRLCADFGSYHPYSEEALNEGIGEGLPQRFDAAFNFVRTGGRLGRREEGLAKLASRTNYFRETYAYGSEIRAPGVEGFYRHEGLMDAARQVFDRPLIDPAIVYANILLPGQELAVHTDVPEFRGVSRKTHPQWLLVVMHHSGLFESWRMPIATAVSWFHDAEGGEFAFYPDGPDAAPTLHPVAFNTAVLLDTDSVFHGVDRVRESSEPLPPVTADVSLSAEGGGRWRLSVGEGPLAEYGWNEMRFSVSWKAYCFRDEAEREAWRQHSDDLSLDHVLDSLRADLRERGRLTVEPASNRELAEQLVGEYIRFPAADGARAAN